MSNIIGTIKLIIGHGLTPATNLLVAFYLSKFSSKETYATYMSILSVLVVVFGFNAKSVVQRRLVKDHTKAIKIQNWINVFWLPIIVFFVIMKYSRLQLVIALSMWTYCLGEIVMERMRYNLDSNKFLLSKVVRSLLDILLFIALSYFLNDLLIGRVISIFTSSILIIIYLYPYVRLERLTASWTDYLNHIKLGFGMLLYSLSMMIFSISDRFILDYYNIDSYYTYFLMSSVASIQMMLGASLAPIFMASLNGNYQLSAKAKYNINIIHLVLLVFLYFLLSAMDNYGLIELDNSWVKIYFLLSLSAVAQANYIYRVQGLIGMSSYANLVRIAMPVAVLSLVLNFVFVPYYGALTAGIVSVFSSLIILYKVDAIST